MFLSTYSHFGQYECSSENFSVWPPHKIQFFDGFCMMLSRNAGIHHARMGMMIPKRLKIENSFENGLPFSSQVIYYPLWITSTNDSSLIVTLYPF